MNGHDEETYDMNEPKGKTVEEYNEEWIGQMRLISRVEDEKRKQETAQLREALKELIEYFEKSEYEKSLVKYDDFRDKIENARKLTNQPNASQTRQPETEDHSLEDLNKSLDDLDPKN